MLNKFDRFAGEYLLSACFLDIRLRRPKLCNVLIAFLRPLVEVTLAVKLRLRRVQIHLPPSILPVSIHRAVARVGAEAVAARHLAGLHLTRWRASLQHCCSRVALSLLAHSGEVS